MDKQDLILNPAQFEEFWAIMVESFPQNERKSKEDFFKQLYEKAFNIKLGRNNSGKIKGFIGWWQLEKYRFVEHFAVSSENRNKGFGKRFFAEFMSSGKYPVALEVELPADEISKHRITFYEHLGLFLHPYMYYQPSYTMDNENVEMLIMTSNPELEQNDFEILRTEIYKTVYDYKISPPINPQVEKESEVNPMFRIKNRKIQK